MILDINMPGATGFELQQVLVAKGIRLPINFLTGGDDVAVGRQVLTSRAVGFLGKPADREVLLTAIQKALSWAR